MHIIFEKVTLHNFLSYGHTEIDLRNRNYCLVKGINNDPLSNSTSNGSGKSSWSSAICWALTGQTIQGLKNNLKNIHIDEKLCYVKLLFSIDDKLFEITRYKEPKSDLKIIINGEDKSGKGIRDSEEILASYIPDLNVDLISSVIILGQSLPGKFTANTPSGRKELLERLSKSDFMITDLKNRLTKVITENQKDLRSKEDSLLENNTKITLLKERLASLNNDLNSKNLLLNRRDECIELKSEITKKETLLNEKNNLFNSLDKEKQSYTEKIYNLKSEQINKNSQIKKSYDERLEAVKANLQQIKLNYLEAKNKEMLTYNDEERKLSDNSEVLRLGNEISNLENEIKRLESIKDICPTCGQKIPNVIKPDTTKQKNDLQQLKDKQIAITEDKKRKLNDLLLKRNNKLSEMDKLKEKYENEVTTEYNSIVSEYQSIIEQSNKTFETNNKILLEQDSSLTFRITILKQEISTLTSEINDLKVKLNNLEFNLKSAEEQLQKIKDTIISVENEIKQLDEKNCILNVEKNDISLKIDVDNKINTLLKRDFRGYLLTNVIKFINSKCKEYCQVIFGNSDINFALDGNNIEVTYRNIYFENLSGGEKQKVDLIIQFSIRDMMSEFLEFSSNIIILDEIFDNLDSLGCNKVIDLISEKLNNVESLFIISHHADSLEIPYDNELIVIKNSNGISTIQG